MSAKPTVGRVVHYFSGSGDNLTFNPRQPLAAFITYVWNDRCVNLAVFSATGASVSRTSVAFGDSAPFGQPRAYWPARAEEERKAPVNAYPFPAEARPDYSPPVYAPAPAPSWPASPDFYSAQSPTGFAMPESVSSANAGDELRPAPVFATGNGGDFAGGGATASYCTDDSSSSSSASDSSSSSCSSD